MHLRRPTLPTLPSRAAARADGGFAMIIALVVLVVAMLLAAAAFSAVQEDTKNTRTYIVQQKAYAAALAGIQAFKYQLGANNNYWATCPKTAAPATVPGTTDEVYTYKFLHSEKHTQKECEEKKQAAMIETSGSANGTFRVEATGRVAGNCGEKVLTEKGFTENAKNKYCTRSVVATFTHPGFINYVFVSNYEILDPVATNPHPIDCEEYHNERKAKKAQKSEGGDCQEIVWAATDKVKGPFHTNDGADITTGATFGREGHNDAIEMNQGHYGGTPKFNGSGYTEEAGTLLPPETDSELLESAESGYKLKGRTEIQLEEGSPNKMKVTKWSAGKAETTTKSFPNNGVVYVEDGSKGCPVEYTPFGSKYLTDSECGNVYVKGTYTESLTIGAANDVIVIGNTTTTGGSAGGEPSGTATLGLIATNFVRVYHPVKETSCGETCKNTSSSCNEENMTTAETEALSKELFGAVPASLIVDAAILSTKHSWIVDNYLCGGTLSTLTVWGSIAQFWRGPVGSGTHGFSSKNYNYDERLSTNQPPSFLSPTTTGAWKAERETTPPEE